MSEIKRYKTIAKAVTVLDGGFLAVKEVVVEECDKGYLVKYEDHLAALKQLQTRCEELEREVANYKGSFDVVSEGYKRIREERDALAAHVELLLDVGGQLRKPWDLSKILGAETRRLVERWDVVIQQTPQHSLAKHNVEVARRAVIQVSKEDCEGWCESDWIHFADQYAQREYGVKDGE